MKKIICMLLALCLLFALAACGKKGPEENDVWTREGYFEDEDGHMLSVTWMDIDGEAGWYVGYMDGPDPIEDSYGGTLVQEGRALRGDLLSSGNMIAITVSITPEGEDGLQLAVEGGETCHFKPYVFDENAFGVSINTEGFGYFNALTDSDNYETNENFDTTSMILSLNAPATYRLSAKGAEGWEFVKWTKDGELLSTEPEVEVEFTESAEILAVFEFPVEPVIDIGESEIFSEEDLMAAAEAIQDKFEEFEGCELFDIRYAGDEECTEENLKWMNELAPGKDMEPNFTQVVNFLSDFHSPVDTEGTAWEADTDYLDWGWWLARADGGEWQILTWGY